MNNARQNLIRILQNAHAGELAAAFAYRGHWRSLRRTAAAEREGIKKIEREEWEHRAGVARWLEVLDANPRPAREKVFWMIGKFIGAACFVSGWFFPMYFAGRLENSNVQEYVAAAEFARELGMRKCSEEMLEMSLTEREHEIFFSQIIAAHRLLPITKTFFRWS